MAFNDDILELSAEDGAFLVTFGVALTGTVFTTGEGVGIVDGPALMEETDNRNDRRTVRQIAVQLSRAACVASPGGKTVVYEGITYTILGDTMVNPEELHWWSLTAKETRLTEGGRRAGS